MGVPRHLQVPLSIDTNINYDLDRSMFPGLDDPRYKHERVLCIAPDPFPTYARTFKHQAAVEVSSIPGYSSSKSTPTTDPSQGYENELLDELLGIMDIEMRDLLTGIKNTEDFHSLVDDVIQGLPHSDELWYLEGPKKYQSDTNSLKQQQSVSVNEPVDRCAVEINGVPDEHIVPSATRRRILHPTTGYISQNNQQSLCMNRNTLDKFAFKNNCVSKGFISSGYANVQAVTNAMCRKRKRIECSYANNMQKKVCYGDGFISQFSNYQTGRTVCGTGFTGTRHGNQISVM